MVKASVKNVLESFEDFNSCNRIVSLQKLYYKTVAYFLKVKN